MKNSKGETLPQPYLALAEMRRAQKPQSASCMGFTWSLTSEGADFWWSVWRGEISPDIPAASLAELEAWEKPKEQTSHDYKAMYENMEKAFNKIWEELEIAQTHLREFESEKPSEPTRNRVAECAMRAYTGKMFSYVKDAWDWAEKWAAEGRKRGHLPETEK